MIAPIAIPPEMSFISPWQIATWDDYVRLQEQVEQHWSTDRSKRWRVIFNQGWVWVKDMSGEGVVHAKVNNLFTLIIGLWFMVHSEKIAESLGGCILEKQGLQSASPDLVLYIGENAPKWQEGEPRRVNLNQWRVPDLVGEIADTTLAIDLDEMKQLYAALGVPEYWVIDAKGGRVLIFQLQETGRYIQVFESLVLVGLQTELLELALQQMQQGTNISAANWFMERIK